MCVFEIKIEIIIRRDGHQNSSSAYRELTERGLPASTNSVGSSLISWPHPLSSGSRGGLVLALACSWAAFFEGDGRGERLAHASGERVLRLVGGGDAGESCSALARCGEVGVAGAGIVGVDGREPELASSLCASDSLSVSLACFFMHERRPRSRVIST